MLRIAVGSLHKHTMTFWTYQNLAAVTKGRWLAQPERLGDGLGDVVAGLWHDTRDIKPGQAYLAIKGETFDGHAFIGKAFAAGASLAIVSDPASLKPQASGPMLCVDDTIKALQDLARAYRDTLAAGGCKVIGIAGSNGKTTTRHLIHHVLTHAGLKGIQSPKSFNNHLGVPLTLLSAKPKDDFVAAEIGTNHPGEIDFLSAIARPDIAVITSIGEEHLEFFHDLDGVADEELTILNHLAGERIVITGDLGKYQPRVAHADAGKFLDAARSSYNPPAAMPVRGKHNRINAQIASAVAACLGVTTRACDAALLTAQPESHRGVLITLSQGVRIYDDCYNANPSSMRAAIDTVLAMDRGPGRMLAILGDMFELGEHSPELHEKVARYASERVPCVLIGEMFSQIDLDSDSLLASHRWSDDLPDKLAAMIGPGDTVLIKGSRGMRLERLIPAIEHRFGRYDDEKPT